MLEALHELFGRSTVDREVEEGFERGQIENILVECGFPPAFARRLAGIEADSVEEFLARVYRQVHRQMAATEPQTGRWPTEGLRKGDEGDNGPGESTGIHQAA